ncbi:ECF transporter S component [Microbacterium sp. NPDC089696]|uniref:ECF transporter S component n=1 Tax=Microbacterium sp. NPDC089696 TaxID=3364199 RepID=UPI00381544EE
MKNISTRLLLTCAAIGVASGIVLLPIFGVFSSAAIAAAPLLYTVFLGFWFFGGVLMQSITHRPGMALLTSVIAGLVIAPFTPYGFSTVLSTATVGLCQELPFLATLYRRWPTWLFYVANGLIGLAYAFPAQAIFTADTPEGVRLAVYPLAAASAVAMTWLARLVAKRLDRMGVTRGLTRTPAASVGPAATPAA